MGRNTMSCKLYFQVPESLIFPFNTVTGGEASIMASGKQIQNEGWSIQAGFKNSANESGIS